MYLKNIEIQGFKSFANKIVFEFHNGITGIVGPNGSGKSNVADAVRWVFGEQKVKQLRSASMQDVIFSGTETRKPQGFASVAITLDNADHQLAIDYDEVTVSRRLYRSGESEYRINGSPCRLKDINELFYDTGIGKEGYSIIGQGQIDKILSGRPEDRRELFDEAAGIVKFKRRKADALKKLEDEEQNLVRVKDILSELEKQVGPLEKQAAAAKEYFRLREELRCLDANLFLQEMEAISKQQRELEERRETVSGDMEGSKTESEALLAEYDRLEEEIRKLDAATAAKQQELNETLLDSGNKEGQINVLREQIRAVERNEELTKERIEAVSREIQDKEQERAAQQTEKEGLSKRAEALLNSLTAAQGELSEAAIRADSLEQAIADGKAELIEALNEKSGLSVKKQRYDTMLEQIQVRGSEVAGKLLQMKSEEEGWESRILEQEKKAAALKAQIEARSRQAKALEAETAETAKALRDLSRELNNTQQDYHMAHTKYESLRNLAERYEGYGNSIRRVMEARAQISGVRGVVADLIDVPKEYETAVETALGGSIQNIVTDTEQTAKRLIEYLKKNRYGRATFLPLSAVSGREEGFSSQILSEPGVLGPASSLVQAKEEYQGLVRYLLGRVLVVDHVDHAIALAGKYHHTLRLVTLEGELFNPGGSMSGGAFKNSSNLLGRKREMEELKERCRQALMKVDEIQKKTVETEKAQAEKIKELESAKELLQKEYLEENTALGELSRLREKKRELGDSTKDLRQEAGQLEEQRGELFERLHEIETEIARLESENEEKNQKLLEAGEAFEAVRAEREAASAKLSSLQVEAANFHQQEYFIEQNIRRLTEEMERLSAEQDGLKAGGEEGRQSVSEKTEQIQALLALIEEAGQKADGLRAEMEEQRIKKDGFQEQRSGFFAKREELTERISQLDKDLFRLQSQKEKLEEKQESFVEYLWSEYELTYSTAEELKEEPARPASELKKRIAENKGAVKALGNVNVNAIEDYREVSGRYEFMKSQYEDLLAAREALTAVITELDTGMRRQFTEKFGQISAEFNRVFRELFGGGHGSLTLMEEEDILEAGIQIISQPPGKKLQNMMQMSGGEKALTAIALLFAIQNLKPSPFCLLDEIEAALDDSNVERYAKYLHKLTKHTQFIVITHRRGTMVAADRLYGITMQEKGVSTLVSVNLIENDLTD